MEHLSTSKSLTNPKFDEWCAIRLVALRMVYGSEAEQRLRNSFGLLDFRFLPFVTWGEDIIHLRVMDTQNNQEQKLIARFSGDVASVGPRIILSKGRTSGFNAAPWHKILRYRHHKSKRWRSPKEIHEAQVAYYLMKYR
jgi:hypothetical protein